MRPEASSADGSVTAHAECYRLPDTENASGSGAGRPQLNRAYADLDFSSASLFAVLLLLIYYLAQNLRFGAGPYGAAVRHHDRRCDP